MLDYNSVNRKMALTLWALYVNINIQTSFCVSGSLVLYFDREGIQLKHLPFRVALRFPTDVTGIDKVDNRGIEAATDAAHVTVLYLHRSGTLLLILNTLLELRKWLSLN